LVPLAPGRIELTEAASKRWALVNEASLAWAVWDTDNALFHGETGETHLLSELPALLLQILAAGPRCEASLSAMAAEQCDAVPDGAWQRKIRQVLTELANLELVEPTNRASP